MALKATDQEILTDVAALVRLLGATIRAHTLGDAEAVDKLLSQVTPTACDRLAGELTHAFDDTAANKRQVGRPPRPANVIDMRSRS